MTENVGGKKSVLATMRDDFRSLSPKQIVAIIAALAISLILEVLGLVSVCIGFLIIAVILYMIPHLMKVTSVSVKAVLGVVFIILSVLIGTFAYGGVVDDYAPLMDEDSDTIRDVSVDFNEETGYYELYFEVNPSSVDAVDGGWNVLVNYGDIGMVSFGMIGNPSEIWRPTVDASSMTDLGGGWYSGTCELTNLTDGKFEYVALGIQDIQDPDAPKVLANLGFTYDTGVSSGDVYKMNLYGSGYSTLMVAFMFFIILIFSAMMRRSATKTREKMEAEGRLYPQGFGRCKSCGAMVLPGEVVCRKCGAYIEVPDELKVQKKDFVTCSECGAEVPADATECPKCGAKFDEAEEVEVSHPDGTVDVTTDTVACPHCGEQIPANADWCPKCGKKVKE